MSRSNLLLFIVAFLVVPSLSIAAPPSKGKWQCTPAAGQTYQCLNGTCQVGPTQLQFQIDFGRKKFQFFNQQPNAVQVLSSGNILTWYWMQGVPYYLTIGDDGKKVVLISGSTPDSSGPIMLWSYTSTTCSELP